MNRHRLNRLFYALKVCLASAALISTSSCMDEFHGAEVIVNTEELLQLNSEDITLLGRLVSSTDSPSELGFYVDTDPAFSNPIILISSDPLDLGTFIATYGDLKFGTTYYFKSYVIVDNNIYFGDVISFETNKPSIVSFEPVDAAIGQRVVISGLNLTKDATVYFGPNQAEVLAIRNKSLIEVIVPDIADSKDINIEVIMQDSTLRFDTQFTYHTGAWTKVGEFPTPINLTGCVVIDIGEEVIIGYGRDLVAGTRYPDLFKVNKETFEWTTISGPEEVQLISDPINYDGGFGGGSIQFFLGFILQSSQSWRYDKRHNSWEANPDLAIQTLSGGIHALLSENDYIFGGIDAGYGISSNIYLGDFDTGIFAVESVAPFEIKRSEAHFTYRDEFYYQSDRYSIMKYDRITNEWINFFGTETDLGVKNIAVMIEDKLYLGLGSVNNIIYEIDFVKGEYIEKNRFIGAPDEDNVAWWAYDGNLYILRTSFTLESRIAGANNMELWELDPEALK